MTCLRVVLGNHQRRSTNSLLPLSRQLVAEVIRYKAEIRDGVSGANEGIDLGLKGFGLGERALKDFIDKVNKFLLTFTLVAF